LRQSFRYVAFILFYKRRGCTIYRLTHGSLHNFTMAGGRILLGWGKILLIRKITDKVWVCVCVGVGVCDGGRWYRGTSHFSLQILLPCVAQILWKWREGRRISHPVSPTLLCEAAMVTSIGSFQVVICFDSAPVHQCTSG